MQRPIVKANEFVSWDTLQGRKCGRVQALVVQGKVGATASFEGFTASPDFPVARIVAYKEVDGAWTPTEEVTYRPTALVGKIEKPLALLQPIIQSKKKDKVGELTLYSDIGSEMWGGISSKMFKQELDSLDGVDRLEVRINSGGGDAFEGLAMHNMLKQSKIPDIVAYVDSLCASAATIVATGAHRISMAEESWFMIHRSATIAFGNATEIEKTLELLKQVDAQQIRIFNKKTNLGSDKVEQLLDAETWMTSDQALNYGFVDEITAAPETRVAASLSRKWFKNPPQPGTVTSLSDARVRSMVAQQARYLKSHGSDTMQRAAQRQLVS